MSKLFAGLTRSELMSRIRSRGNKKTELALIKLFRANSITGWRRHQKIFGRPDFAFREKGVVVFVDGCFWHGCPRCYRRPKSNRKFWDAKFLRNRERDQKVKSELRKLGWRVLRIWEHDLTKKREKIVIRIKTLLEAPVRRNL